MKTFYFNTGVRPENCNGLGRGEVWRGGVKQIPFDCVDVPNGASFLFACDNPDLRESKCAGVIVREMFNTSMVSKFAYFQLG